MQNTAYGASFAGGAFDLASFVKQPQTILRLLSWVSDCTEIIHGNMLASIPAVASSLPGFCNRWKTSMSILIYL